MLATVATDYLTQLVGELHSLPVMLPATQSLITQIERELVARDLDRLATMDIEEMINNE